MKDYMAGLNENQKKAVVSENPYLRIVAGAGSGKTRVLTTRIVHLIDEFKVDPKRILAITFTNKAANEMKKRIERMLEGYGNTPHISTIHSFCVTVLRQDINYLNYPRNFTIIDTEDQKTILKEGYKKYDLDHRNLSYSMVLDYIGGHKAAEISVEIAKNRAADFGNERYKALLYEYYVERQTQLYALDFDDLLIWVKKLFETNAAVLHKWQNRFQVILVDEFQDIDHIQYAIIKALAGANNALYVVGDPDQTIYTWRGADVNIIMNLEKDFPGLETIMLTTNYRSNTSILNAANNVIANNKYRVPKDLVAASKEVHDIVYYGAVDEENESLWIASTIKELAIRKEVDYDDIAILYRANYLSRSLEKSLVNMQIPYVIYGGIGFYDRKEIKDVLCYLRLLVSEDDLALKRIINVPRRKVGDKSLSTIEEKSWADNITMYQVLVKYPDLFSGAIKEKLKALVDTVEELKKSLKKMTLPQLVDLTINKVGYKEMLINDNEGERLENVKELINDIEDFVVAFPNAGLEEYLQIVSLYTDRESDERETTVKLMTIHAAKGLEFDSVFVCGMNEGVFPSNRSLEDGIKGLEEERRLAYVAYTRAKHRLFVSDPKGYSHVLSQMRRTSRFIEEIGWENLKLLGKADYSYWQDTRFEPEAFSDEIPEQRTEIAWKVGDKVEHDTFHEGVLIKITDDVLEIAFSYPYGIKKIARNFAHMRRAK